MYSRESKIMRKLLGRTAADASSSDLTYMAPTATLMPAAYRPSQARDAVYAAGVPIACFDVAPDRRTAVLGGLHVLRTVGLDAGFGVADGIDMRAVIASRQSAAVLRANVVADQLNIRDAKWQGSSTVFTACASGNVFAYDLARVGASAAAEPLEYIVMQEDSRQVNSLDVNPHLKSWLLSGSQDGAARVFDTSTPLQGRSGLLTFRQRFAPLRCNEAVRQVKWSPKLGHEMACCTEGGVLLKWDVRQTARPLLRINAHEKVCSAIAWHPDGVYLLSAGWDTKLHVWNLGGAAEKRQKPKWTIPTPAPVSAVAWRPGLWSATSQSRRIAQVAVAYDESSNRRYGTSTVHIWDLARPTMPYKEIESFDSSPVALMWQDQDLLWTAGPDGLFSQCDVAFAPKALNRQSTSASAFSPRGDVVMFLDERPQYQRPRRPVSHEADMSRRQATGGSGSVTPMLSVSRSDSEEEVMGVFLGPHRRLPNHRGAGVRSTLPLSTTPPSGPSFPEDTKQPLLNLEQSVAVTGMFNSHQAMASGRIPATKSVQVYQYLSNVYLETLAKELPCREDGKPLAERVGHIMEQYAWAAEKAGFFRLAQMWRVLAYATALLLARRARYHLECRLDHLQNVAVEGARGKTQAKATAAPGAGQDASRREAPARGSVDGRLPARSLLAEEMGSLSNVPMPVARPVDVEAQGASGGVEDGSYRYGQKLTPIVEPENLSLGAAAHGPDRAGADAASATSGEGGRPIHVPSTEGYDFYDAEVLARAIDVPMPKGSSTILGRTAQAQAQQGPGSPGKGLGHLFTAPDGSERSMIRSPTSGGGVFAQAGLARQPLDTERSSGGASSIEYESRIRGEAMEQQKEDALTLTSWAAGQAAHAVAMESPDDDVFIISQTTDRLDEAQLFQDRPSQTSRAEADDEMHDEARATTELEAETHGAKSTKEPSSSPRHDAHPFIVDTDYLPCDDDPPYPHPLQSDNRSTGTAAAATPPALDPVNLLTRALGFEAARSALNASAMILLLKPLVPDAVIDDHLASAILRQQHTRLARMSLFVEVTLLRKLCVRGWPAGLADWGPVRHTAVFAPVQQGVKVGLFCPDCGKPREADATAGAGALWTCERCRRVMAPCAVCGHHEPERPAHVPVEMMAMVSGGGDDDEDNDEKMFDPWLSAWWCCPGCAHGGHASCLQMWHGSLSTSPDSGGGRATSEFSDGCCPFDSCGHACLPGKYRGEMLTARADELGRAVALDAARACDDAPRPPPVAATSMAASSDPLCGSASAPSSLPLPGPVSPVPSLLQSLAGGRSVSSGSQRASPHHGAATTASDQPHMRGDTHDVPQSRAVGVVRETLSRARSPAAAAGILSSSPGRDRDRRKSVKFARPDRI